MSTPEDRPVWENHPLWSGNLMKTPAARVTRVPAAQGERQARVEQQHHGAEDGHGDQSRLNHLLPLTSHPVCGVASEADGISAGLRANCGGEGQIGIRPLRHNGEVGVGRHGDGPERGGGAVPGGGLLAAGGVISCTRAVIESKSTGFVTSYRDLCPDAFPRGV